MNFNKAEHVAPLADGLRAAHFAPQVTEHGDVGAETTEFIRSYGYGFYGERPSDERIKQVAKYMVADDAQLTAIYPDPIKNQAEREYGLGESFPVGTFLTMPGSFNAGAGLVPVVMCTDATVNAGYRRKGILRYMMTEAIARGRENGAVLAALVATEGIIYQRFGFGVSTRQRHIKVDTGVGFGLRVPTAGRVFTADPTKMGDLAKELIGEFHHQIHGSISQLTRYEDIVRGIIIDRDGTTAAKRLRAAIYTDDSGKVAGYVIYTVKEGASRFDMVAEIVDMITVTSEAYLQLWKFLGALDLVREFTWAAGPVNDPLVTALIDPRSYKIEAQTDFTWTRILDLPKAFAARAWGSDGQFVLHVEDSLDYTAGRWQINVVDEQAEVEKIADDDSGSGPRLTLTTDHLASAYSGDVEPQILVSSGQAEIDPNGEVDAIDKLNRIFDLGNYPYSVTFF